MWGLEVGGSWGGKARSPARLGFADVQATQVEKIDGGGGGGGEVT